jgi:tryptophan-rich sensory protein
MPGLEPALLISIQFYAASLYPKFEGLGFEKSKEAANACSQWSLEEPLWMIPNKKREIVHLGKVTSIYALAVISAFLVWTQKKIGNSIPDSPMLLAAADGWELYKLENREEE